MTEQHPTPDAPDASNSPDSQDSQDNPNNDIQSRLAAAGLSLADLAAAGLVPTATAATGPDRTVAAQVRLGLDVLRRDQPGSLRTWSPYLTALAAGFGDVCPCPCLRCSSGPCPCSTAVHHDDCQTPTGEQLDCAGRYRGIGGRDVDSVLRDDLTELAWWARRRALKRTVRRNAARAAKGLPPLLSDGRGAAEAAIQGARWWFNWLQDNEVTQKNPAARLKLPARQERPARSLDVAELLEVYRVAVTTGTDPELDGLLLRHQLIHAVRRGGLLEASAGGVSPVSVSVTYWDRKRQTNRTRPSTRAHVAHLLAHVLERGPRLPALADAPPEVRRTGVPAITDDAPLFYRRPVDTFDEHGYLLHREVRPVTRKHIETLFTRIKRHLPWAARQDLRPHDLRHTSARLVYKASDQQMARLHLAHDAASATDHYLAEQLEELAKLKEALFGAEEDPHPDPDPDQGGCV